MGRLDCLGEQEGLAERGGGRPRNSELEVKRFPRPCKYRGLASAKPKFLLSRPPRAGWSASCTLAKTHYMRIRINRNTP